MSKATSADAFERTLENRFNDFKAALAVVVNAFGFAQNAPERINAIDKLGIAGGNLIGILDTPDRPEWLSNIYRCVNVYKQGRGDTDLRALIDMILRYHSLIQKYKFDFSTETHINFDQIFKKYRDEYRLPELFDDLIATAGKIIESGEVDSVIALRSLQQIIDLLRANRNGSYVAVKSTIISVRFLRNLVSVFIDKVPVIKEFREAFDRLEKETEQEFLKAEAAMQSETIRVLSERMPQLQQLPNYEMEIMSFKEPLALPAPLPSKPTAGE